MVRPILFILIIGNLTLHNLARAKQPSNPRAAPVTSKGAARNSSVSATSSSRGGHQSAVAASGASRSSAPPAGRSSASKRTRRDTRMYHLIH